LIFAPIDLTFSGKDGSARGMIMTEVPTSQLADSGKQVLFLCHDENPESLAESISRAESDGSKKSRVLTLACEGVCCKLKV
jgi:hypothetical protein